jgi:nucleotide-binding universal stress UspA family protein
MRKIIVPLDGSELSRRAVSLGEMLVRAFSGTLELVNILDDPSVVDLMSISTTPDLIGAESYLKHVADELPDDIQVKVWAVRGNPTEELLKLTEEDPDVIIAMSTHGRGGLGRVMFGSVADKVLRGASGPVAVMRSNGHDILPKLRTMLVPLDGSRLSEEVLPMATELATNTGATISLVRVIDPYYASTFVAETPEAAYLSPEQISQFEQQSLADARAYLDAIATDLRAKDLRTVWEVRIGRAADEIARAAETTAADLVLMSTHGRGGIRRWALGSITDEVLHRSSTPILAIPPRMRERDKAVEAEVTSTAR